MSNEGDQEKSDREERFCPEERKWMAEILNKTLKLTSSALYYVITLRYNLNGSMQ